jgi:hypothetical protein
MASIHTSIASNDIDIVQSLVRRFQKVLNWKSPDDVKAKEEHERFRTCLQCYGEFKELDNDDKVTQ